MKRALLGFVLVVGCFSSLFAQFAYPATRTVDSSDTYFGVTYQDPYRWLEKIEEPDVQWWFKQEASFTDSVLGTLNGRNALIAEWKQLDKGRPAQIGKIWYEHGRYFYLKTLPGENVGKLYFRDGLRGSESMLFDPSAYLSGKILTIADGKPSHDGRMMGIVLTEGGAEIGTLKIMKVDTKEFLMDSISPTVHIYCWTEDNTGFLYPSIKSGDSKDPQAYSDGKTKLHSLGTDQLMDVDFFSRESYPALKMDPNTFPYAFLAEDAKGYIFSEVAGSQNEYTQYYAPINQLRSNDIQWQSLCSAADKIVRSEVFINDDVYAITYNHAKNYKVVTTSLLHPDWDNAATIAPENPDQTVEHLAYAKDYLLISYSDGINTHLSKYNFKTKTLSDVRLPYSGTIYISCFNHQSNTFFLDITSWNKPVTGYDYDAVTDAVTPSIFDKPSNYPAPYNQLQVEEVQVKGHDGVMIPLSIIHSKDLKMNGSNICLIDSYGAYGVSNTPYFDELTNSLAIRGVVIAIAHVRGGGEKGEGWYKGGFKTTKPNTWKDFISCAEYLIAKGYTSPSKLAGTGTSAGGVLISRAITERPDLFAAAICNVGCANVMRMEFTANGPMNIGEFGTVKDSIECRALYVMDGVQHVVKGTRYPAVLAVAGWNDARVVAWEPGKFAAALQNASTSGKPVLMKVNYDNGHFSSERNVTYANFADQYSFILWQCGNPDFQPKRNK